MTNKDFIESVVEKSACKNELREVFSDHFDAVSKPVSVSLGLYMNGQNVQDVVNHLRKAGIDAVPYYDPQVKDNTDCFIVDGTGIRFPFLEAKEAVQATADVFEVMKKTALTRPAPCP